MYLLLAHPGSGRSTLLKVLSGKTQNSALLKVGAPLAADAPSAELQGRCLPCFRAISVSVFGSPKPEHLRLAPAVLKWYEMVT